MTLLYLRTFHLHTPLRVVVICLLFLLSGGEKVFSDESVKPPVDAMKLGVKVLAPTPLPERYYNDLIHPCVRYIPQGFAGHKWWMVGSPYRNGDMYIENPILFYGDSREGNLPPLSWTAVGVIEETPPVRGYNSDPNIYFDGKGLWVFWRENATKAAADNGYSRATFGRYSTDGITFGPKKLFAGEKKETEDSEMAPVVFDVNGKIQLFGVHHQFTPQRAPWGLSIWDIENNDLQSNMFTKTMDVLPVYKAGFDFWHFDLFTYNGKFYCVATPESANEILLGVSDDGINFKFWDTPLLSTEVTKRSYFYKATAMVHQGVFYLWNPVAELGSPVRTTRIWMSEIDFDDLINILSKNGTSAEEENNKDLLITPTTGGILLSNIQKATRVTIYDVRGALIFQSSIVDKSCKIELPKGFFIVKTDDVRIKVIVN